MPIHVSWSDEAHKVLVAEYVGAFTRREIQQAIEKRKHLLSSINYPVGIIEDESRGYLVPDLSTHQLRVPGKHTYTSSTDFSAQNALTPNRIAVTIKIPYAQDTWQNEEDGLLWNTHSREKLQTVLQYPTLASVSVMMTIEVDEAKLIILEYLSQLEGTKQKVSTA